MTGIERARLRVLALREGASGARRPGEVGRPGVLNGAGGGTSWHKVQRMAPGISHLLGAGPGGKEMAGHWPLTDRRVLVLEKNLEILKATPLVFQLKI